MFWHDNNNKQLVRVVMEKEAEILRVSRGKAALKQGSFGKKKAPASNDELQIYKALIRTYPELAKKEHKSRAALPNIKDSHKRRIRKFLSGKLVVQPYITTKSGVQLGDYRLAPLSALTTAGANGMCFIWRMYYQ